MGIKIEAKTKHKRIDFYLILESRPYIDTVIKISPLSMRKGDTLKITYNLVIEGFTNGTKTSELPERFSYLFMVNKNTTVLFVRFVKFEENASILIYKQMPLDIYLPKKWNAQQLPINEERR